MESNHESESQSNYYNINFFSESTELSSDDNSFTQKSSIGKVDIDKFLINIQTQKGSITYQYLINQYSFEEINSLFIQLTPFLISIMCSEYGNYFFQRLVCKLNVYQRLIIFHQIKNKFIQIAANSSGTYSIQVLISAISTEKEDKILRELIQHNLLLMFTNENAHHVIQKLIIEFSEERRKYINDCIFEKLDKICVNEYGYLWVIKFINNNSSLLNRVELIQAINILFYLLEIYYIYANLKTLSSLSNSGIIISFLSSIFFSSLFHSFTVDSGFTSTFHTQSLFMLVKSKYSGFFSSVGFFLHFRRCFSYCLIGTITPHL